MDCKSLVVTEEHLTLLKRMYIRSSQGVEYDAPCVDPKRPYGNSDVPQDIYKILGWEIPFDEEWGEPHVPFDDARARAIHEEMATVLQILVRNPGVDLLGEWRNVADYGVDWRRDD